MGWQDRDYNKSQSQQWGGPGRGRSGGGGFGGGGFGGGGGGGSFMQGLNSFFNQTFPLGTYFDIRVRIHITFFILLIFRLLPGQGPWNPFWTLRWIALLFLSVLLHEFGHALACRRVGGFANDILIWPLGGLAFCAPPRRPWPEFVTVVWGPLVNVIIAGACFITLSAWTGMPGGGAMPVSLNPLNMWIGYSTGVQGLLADLFVVNYALLLFNVFLVFYPFDGGRLVQIALWVKYGYGRSMTIATNVGMVGAVLVALYGLAYMQLLLCLIGVFGFVTCYQQKQILRQAGPEYSFAGGGADFDPGYYNQRDAKRKPKRPSMIKRYFEARKARKRAADARRREQLDAEVDRILAKVKAEGIQNLTDQEKKTLERATNESRTGS